MNKGSLAGLVLLLSSGAAMADWQVDNAFSKVNFVSVKKDTIGETHYFKQVSGTLSDKGQLNIAIDLASVETIIPIRNERMRKFLFNTKTFPNADISADINMKQLKMAVGESKMIKTSADLGLHGVNKLISVEVMVTKVAKDKLLVTSMKPIIVNPADFGMAKGVDKLRELAMLPSITQSVPVSFVLTLVDK